MVSSLLVGQDTDLGEPGEDFPADDSGGGEDDGPDDDLEDAPDSREYSPVDADLLAGMEVTGGANVYPDGGEDDDSDDDSDVGDTDIKPDDVVVLADKAEEDFASLEVYVYEPANGNLYVHHEIALPSFPLCVAHGEERPGAAGGAGNLAAVGTFDPGIEIWDLDVLDVLEPLCTLGGTDDGRSLPPVPATVP